MTTFLSFTEAPILRVSGGLVGPSGHLPGLLRVLNPNLREGNYGKGESKELLESFGNDRCCIDGRECFYRKRTNGS